MKLPGSFVEAMHERGLDLDTGIGEGGRSWSGGQRQRVAIAPAWIRSRGSAAALDSEIEKIAVASLQRAMKENESMEMATHRLGVVPA